MTENDLSAIRIDLHVQSTDCQIDTAVLSMDELRLVAGPLNLYLNAEAVKIIYKRLRDEYSVMSSLSALPDPLPSLD